MWIRSQNKLELHNVLDGFVIRCVKFNTQFIIEGYTNEKVYSLGEYSTKEKAITILNDIQGEIIRQDELSQLNRWSRNVIYEMSQDNEVKTKL